MNPFKVLQVGLIVFAVMLTVTVVTGTLSKSDRGKKKKNKEEKKEVGDFAKSDYFIAKKVVVNSQTHLALIKLNTFIYSITFHKVDPFPYIQEICSRRL